MRATERSSAAAAALLAVLSLSMAPGALGQEMSKIDESLIRIDEDPEQVELEREGLKPADDADQGSGDSIWLKPEAQRSGGAAHDIVDADGVDEVAAPRRTPHAALAHKASHEEKGYASEKKDRFEQEAAAQLASDDDGDDDRQQKTDQDKNKNDPNWQPCPDDDDECGPAPVAHKPKRHRAHGKKAHGKKAHGKAHKAHGKAHKAHAKLAEHVDLDKEAEKKQEAEEQDPEQRAAEEQEASENPHRGGAKQVASDVDQDPEQMAADKQAAAEKQGATADGEGDAADGDDVAKPAKANDASADDADDDDQKYQPATEKKASLRGSSGQGYDDQGDQSSNDQGEEDNGPDPNTEEDRAEAHKYVAAMKHGHGGGMGDGAPSSDDIDSMSADSLR